MPTLPNQDPRFIYLIISKPVATLPYAYNQADTVRSHGSFGQHSTPVQKQPEIDISTETLET
jgi:hypothetical protein